MSDYIGDTIKDLRHSQGLTLRKLSDMSGVNETSICHWETGHSEPRWSYAEAVLNAMGYSVKIVREK
jgi:transcriptional regulator with XRE-family HTH domain